MWLYVKAEHIVSPLFGSAATLAFVNWAELYQAALLGIVGGVFGYVGRLVIRGLIGIVKSKFKNNKK